MAYGKVSMSSSVSLLQFIAHKYPKGPPFRSVEKPLSMEEVNQAYGFLVYRTTIPSSLNLEKQTVFIAMKVHDRSIIFVDGNRQATVKRGLVNVTIQAGKQLEILVENQGRLCYGSHGMRYLPDPKGIISHVYINSQVVKNWEMFPLHDINSLSTFQWMNMKPTRTVQMDKSSYNNKKSHMFYSATFNITSVADTFIKMEGWEKGQIFINAFNLGRYWQTQKGPQKTLYVPKTVLKVGENHIHVMELDRAPCNDNDPKTCFVELVDKPILV